MSQKSPVVDVHAVPELLLPQRQAAPLAVVPFVLPHSETEIVLPEHVFASE